MPERLTPTADNPVAPVRRDYTNDRACWRSYVLALIYGAATSPASYAREVLARKPKASQALAEHYGAEMGRKLVELYGQPTLTGLGQDGRTKACPIIALARTASGEDLPASEAAERFAYTISHCGAWLPKPPASGRQLIEQERNRRAGVTQTEREAAGELAAQEWRS